MVLTLALIVPGPLVIEIKDKTVLVAQLIHYVMAFIPSFIHKDRLECLFLLLRLLLEHFDDILWLNLLSSVYRIRYVLCHSEVLITIVGQVGREGLNLTFVIRTI